MAKNHRPMTDKDGEVRELNAVDLKKFKPAAESHPELAKALRELSKAHAKGEVVLEKQPSGMVQLKRKRGGQPLPAASKRQVLSVRVAPAIAKAIKAHGRGVNAKIEKVLRDAIEEGRL